MPEPDENQGVLTARLEVDDLLGDAATPQFIAWLSE